MFVNKSLSNQFCMSAYREAGQHVYNTATCFSIQRNASLSGDAGREGAAVR